MKIKITEEIAGKVVIRDTIIKLNVNPFDSEGSKIPLAIFEHKGDILVADAVASPEVVPVGNDGQVLVADSSESTGVKWKTMQLGTITLVNSESSAIPSGTVVTNGDTSGTFRIATSADTTNLFVTSENISAGDDGVLYAVSGISCNVRVTADAVEIGDSLIVSSTNGVAEADEGSGFATAVTAKAAGAVGTVTCVLVNTMVSTLTVPEGGTGRVSLTENALLAGDGTNAVKLIPTHRGVLYASGDGAEPVFIEWNNAGAHNSIYRGISLGTSVSAAQFAAIDAGTFEDMYIGDYWTISGSVYRIAAFNYFYNCGDTPFTSNHVTIVPDTYLASSKMNDTDTTDGGYYGSGIRASGSGLASASAIINSAFSGHVATHRQYLTNAVTNGKPSGGSWYDCSVELMSEIMVYGCGIFKPVSDGTTLIVDYTISKSQFPLFSLNPKLIISSRYNWWLRDVVSAAFFAHVHTVGFAAYYSASTSLGVRPAFSIIG